MKTSSGIAFPGARRRAFTLIELLTVISIIVILAGLTIGIISIAQKKSYEGQAQAQLNLITTALTRYYEKFGEYPPFTGESNDSRGGQALYQALTGDGDDLLGGETSSDGKLDEDERRASQDYRLIAPESDNEGLIGKDGDGKYTLKDPFDAPWQYRTFDKDTPSATRNNTYDVWSFGDDKTGEDERKWIKNWKGGTE